MLNKLNCLRLQLWRKIFLQGCAWTITIMVIMFWDFLMFDQFFFSPQVKRSVIIRDGIYELNVVYTNCLRICRTIYGDNIGLPPATAIHRHRSHPRPHTKRNDGQIHQSPIHIPPPTNRTPTPRTHISKPPKHTPPPKKTYTNSPNICL